MNEQDNNFGEELKIERIRVHTKKRNFQRL